MSKIAVGFGGDLQNDPCPRCGTKGYQRPVRITLRPMKAICMGCGLVLIELSFEEEEDLQERMIKETGIPIGGNVCEDCKEEIDD